MGSLIVEALTNQSDEELLESLLFDVRYQYALHTTHFEEQPMSDRTLGRFRARCNAYELETGIDLIHDAVVSLADEMAKLMKINRQLKRMDSLMVASNIKKMSRLELLYTCTANLVKEMDKQGIEIPAGQKHYLSSSDYNQVIYHNRSEGAAARIDSVLSDVQALLPLCEGQLDGSSAYLLLLRVLSEQTEKSPEGRYRLKGAGSGMTADILQNPADPEATFREKAGKQYRGYAANVIEETGEGGSLVTDYQYEQNTYSDSQFARDSIERLGDQEETVTIVSDGAYSGQTNVELAAEHNIELVFTNLTGKETRDIHADFEFNEEGTKVIRCAGGNSPRSCCYNEKNGQCVASFESVKRLPIPASSGHDSRGHEKAKNSANVQHFGTEWRASHQS